MTISAQQGIAKYLFEKLRRLDYRVMLAGGAPRDWYFQREATDLDFYVRMPTIASGREAIQALESVGLIVEELGEAYNDSDTDIAYVTEGTYGGVTFQVMFINVHNTSVLNTFDISLCQIAWTPEAGFELSDIFMLGEIERTVYYTGAKYSKHAIRVRSKYPMYIWKRFQTSEVFRALIENQRQIGAGSIREGLLEALRAPVLRPDMPEPSISLQPII